MIQRRNGPDAEPILARMLGRIAHRGPDGEGRWIQAAGEWTVALGHRRLSIIDVAGGAQPMHSADGRFSVVYNGEIYNFPELRSELEAHGAEFRTRGDTEVLLHHMARHGRARLPDLNGMFAFALWDEQTGELTLARDRAGIKPLYYAPLASGGIVFGSELTALLEHPDVGRRLNPQALASYLFHDYVPAPMSFVDGVHKLPPAHATVWRAGQLTELRPYWTFPRETSPAVHDAATLARELEARLEKAVERQMVSDVPLGIFLSGGLDSSAIASLARRRGGAGLMTFSIGFANRSFDESANARRVAAHIGSDHHEEILTDAAAASAVTEAIGILDEPLADGSIVPTYLLSRLAARHVKVALGGDGGDELWAGYPTYRAAGWGESYGRFPAWARALVHGAVAQLPTRYKYQSLEWKLKRFTNRWERDPLRRHFRWVAGIDLPQIAELGGGVPTVPFAPFAVGDLASQDLVARLLALDFQSYLPGSVLTKVDRAAMAHGLEVRPPFLDNELIAWAASLPTDWKLHRGTTKFLLKKSAAAFLPKDIVERRKQGFAAPLGPWLRGPLAKLLAATAAASPLFEGPRACLRADVFRRWCGEQTDGRADHSKALWSVLVLDHWIRKNGIQTNAIGGLSL